jgi:hypothetical protein
VCARRTHSGNVPELGLLLYELLHERLAFFIMQDHDLYAPLLQVCFTAHEIVIFPDDDSCDLYKRHAPVHISQGDRVVYMVAPR